MGVDYHFHVCRRTSDNKWEELVFYRKIKENKFEPIRIDYGRNHTLYEYLHKSSASFNFSSDLAAGDLKELLEDRFPKDKSFTGYCELQYANLADLKLYVYDNPVVVDYDAEELPDGSLPQIDNPISMLIKDAESIINFIEEIWDVKGFSDYCIVFYCDI